MAEFEPILKSRRYVLGESEEYYGIWDRREGRGPFERFPLTEEGFDAAEARFHELTRRRRRDPDRYRMVLLGIVVGGAALWVAAGIFTAVGYELAFLGVQAEALLFRVMYVLDAVGYRLALGAVLVLAALFVVSRGRSAGERSGDEGASERDWDRVLLWVVLAGLAVWILSAVGTRTVEPTVPPGFVGGPRANRTYVAATLVEAIAFRVWVAAAVLLAVSRLVRARPTT